ncbi:MAG: triple tyrosine motif-containing protein [Chitinophagales bacterium]|jgi:AraC family chitin signaling transcriptional activator|nr:LuxR C-terminal-related transcriptional regulator [Sphingobacteriales bacterium]
MNSFIAFLFILFIHVQIFAQQIVDKGVPYISNFKNQQDKIYTHTWDLDEASNKIMYFVNDKGLLEFDGNQWNLYKGSKGITRSLKVKANDLIYTGSDNDFGEWRLNKNNQFEYKSLYDKFKNSKLIEEFWNVYLLQEKIIFQSFNHLYIYHNGIFTILKAPSRFVAGNQLAGKIYLVDEKDGLLVFDGDQIKNMELSTSLDYGDVIAIDDFGGDIHLITKRHGIISVHNGRTIAYKHIRSFPKNDLVFSYQRINKDYYALGTIQNGVLILNNQAEVVHKISKTKGLQNNTVLSMYYSSNGYLWLGLDFGIDAVFLKSPVSYFIDYQGAIGTTYTALLDARTLYLGTNQGLYSIEYEALKNNRDNYPFRLIPNSQGQVWTLKKEGNMILVGHDKGLYKLTNNQLTKIDDKAGVLTILKLGNYVMTGNYGGVHTYKINGTQIAYFKKIPELLGSFNQMLSSNNKILALLPNEGVLEFEIDSNFKLVRKKIYPKQRFGQDPIQISITGQTLNVLTLDSIYSKSLLVNDKEFTARRYRQNIILKNHILQDNFLPIRIDDSYELNSIYNGFSLKNLELVGDKSNSKLAVPLIRSVFSFDNFEKVNIADKGKVKFKMNNVLINFVSPSLDEDIEYQYILSPLQDWSTWDKKTSAEFLNLKEGKYTFKLKARHFDNVSEIQSFTFVIQPPFYRSWWAYIVYVILMILSYYFLRSYNREKLKKQKMELLKKQRESMEEQSRKYNEKIEQERREKLELEQMQLKKTLENKELELAKKSIDQIEINTMITSIKNKFEEVQNNSKDKLSNHSFNEFIQYIDKKINNELTKEYEIAFDSSQTKFYETLLKAHPSLSAKDLRICSYLLMNLSSKEIAKILNVMPTSIDVSRSRLRKKLNLTEEDNLREYLSGFNV